MEIKTDKRIIEGTHKGQSFRYVGGVLEAYGRTWSKTEIQKLIEIANLLEISGHKLQVKAKKEQNTNVGHSSNIYWSTTNPGFISYDEKDEDEAKNEDEEESR